MTCFACGAGNSGGRSFRTLTDLGLRVGGAREIAEKSTVIDCESDGHHSPRLFSLLLLVESSNLKLIFFPKTFLYNFH